MLKLFYGPGTVALASHIALEEAGADYEGIKTDIKTGAHQTPEYLAINPKGRVPALITDEGILTETPAILVYIAQTHPAAKLAPLDDPFRFAQLQAFTSYMASTVHVAHAHKHRGHRWADQESSYKDMTAKVPETMSACAAYIDSDLLQGPWVLGDDYSVADAYLFTVARWLESDGVDVSRFKNIEAHFARMSERPAVKRAMEKHFA